MNSIFTTDLFFTMLPMMVGAGVVAIGAEYLKVKLERKLKEKYGETSEERIDRLAKSLKEAASLSSDIEEEINRRHAIVEKLKTDAQRYDDLAKLKEAEVEAVVQTMRGELQREGNRSFWKAAAINLVFFIAGVIATIYVA